MRSAGRASKTGIANEPNPHLWPKALARIPRLEFRRAPLLAAACWFALGEVMARNHAPTALLLLAMLLLLTLSLIGLHWSLRIGIVPLAALWMALGLLCAEVQPAPPTQHALTAYADGLSRQIRGRVVRVHESADHQEDPDHDKEAGWWTEKEEADEAAIAGALSVDIKVDAVEEVTPDIAWMTPISGGVRMNVIPDNPSNINAALPTLKCGDLVQAPMRMKVAEHYRDPGAWQYADYLLAQGIGAHASVRASKVSLLDQAAAPTIASNPDRVAQWQCRLFTAQSWASSRVLGYVHSRANRGLPKLLRLIPDDAPMLNAMLFGDRAGLNKTQRVGFERTGSFHLFVVSGMHVGLLAGLVFWLARRFLLGEWMATSLTFALTFGFALLKASAHPCNVRSS